MAKLILIDTDVLSYLMDNRPELERFFPILTEHFLCVSFITCGEIFSGAYKKGWGSSRMQLLRNTFASVTILGYDEELPEIYGKLVAHCSRIGRPIAVNDAWIAASALAYELPLLTNNKKHFVSVPGLQLL